ncbi:hypothetical protein IRJ41_024978 [Triplophysa rosa]|uniref:Uncharacterized protein n=1 Tax=Triplophysa rosa TaxID=992332 RepID=A0A9W7WAY7_TRIRA|nr:hypothetical protein IRJ41_024978 [Triplophysa rosa]
MRVKAQKASPPLPHATPIVPSGTQGQHGPDGGAERLCDWSTHIPGQTSRPRPLPDDDQRDVLFPTAKDILMGNVREEKLYDTDPQQVLEGSPSWRRELGPVPNEGPGSLRHSFDGDETALKKL